MGRIWMLLVLGWILTGTATLSDANMGGGGGGGVSGGGGNPAAYEKAQKIQGLYQNGVEAGDKGDFNAAIGFFEDALKLNPDNPDALNMLAHAQRKAGRIDEALDNYKKALRLRPNFAEAREYLGEAYIQAALREMDTLKSYGKDGQEQLEDLRQALKDAAEKPEKPPSPKQGDADHKPGS